MYSFTDVNNIFESSNNFTVYEHDDDQYVEENVLHIPTATNYEEDGSDISEIHSFGSSPIATDVQTGNGILNPESSERRDIGLRSIYEIPRKYQHVFASYPCFNAIQSEVLDDVLYSDVSIVVSAPTGSGKTAIFELAIIRLLIKLEETEYTDKYKIVYMAPVKALCSERLQDWRPKFSSLGLRCIEYTGDTEENELTNLLTYHLILTTPEKWDSLTRKWKDNKGIVQMVKLFLIDEVHLLNEEQRGPTLEAVVSRMKTVQGAIGVTRRQQQGPHQSDSQTLLSGIRFLAISATIPNTEDIACWLGDSLDSPARFFKIGEEMRPVKLQKIVLGYPYPAGTSQFHFEMSLSYKLRAILFKYADGKPTLIFCSTRKGVEHTCSIVTQQITFHFTEEHKHRIFEAATVLTEKKLKDCVMAGVGYHHAGMVKEDRQAVESLFRDGILPVLVTTSTLAMGVNLPAHLVIIKATQQYIGGSYKDYTDTQILQMIGRAGRPQFDTSAVAIIMTKEMHRSRYEKVMSGKDLIESNLHQHLAEHLNSEVVLRTITDIGYAMEWIRSTYLYVRALQNPGHYGIPSNLNRKGIEGKLQEMCQRELNALASAKLLTIDHRMDVHPTKDGVLMARFYLNLGTMKAFHKVQGHESLEKLVEIVSACQEFSGMKLRVSEKKNLNLLNKARDRESIRFPLPTRIMTTEMKINCLIQAFLGCLPIHESSLKQDVLRIMWIGKRVTNALAQYLLQQPHYQALVSAVTLAKCFHCKLWENSPHMSRQLKGIGAALSSMLAVSNKTSFQSIIESNPRDLESILNRPPPTGDNLKAEVNHLPHFELKTEIVTNPSITELHVYVEMTNRALVQENNTAGNNHWIFLIVGGSNNKCIYKERFKDTNLLEHMEHWTVEITDPLSVNEVYVNLISEKWVGLDVCCSLKLHQPTQVIPVQVKNSIKKYLMKQAVDNPSLSFKSSTPQTIRRTKFSIVDQIKEMSEKRLGNMTPNKITLMKMAYMPAKKKKLSPSLNRLKSKEDEKTDDLPQFSSLDRHTPEQENPEINFRHFTPNLITDKQAYIVHKYCGIEQDAVANNTNNQQTTLLQDRATNSPEHLQMQVKQCRVAKCAVYPDKQNNYELQDSGIYQSAGTQSVPSLRARTSSTYEVQTTEESNSTADRIKLSEREMSSHKICCMLPEPLTPRLMEDCHETCKENATLNDSSILENKHSEKDMDKTLLSQLTISNSQLRNLETNNCVTSNSQLPHSSNLQNDSLTEECNDKGLETEEHNFQNGNDSEYIHETTLSLDTHNDHCEKYLQREMLQTNILTSGTDWAIQEKSVMPLNDIQPEQSSFHDERSTENNSDFMCESKDVDSTYWSVGTEQSVTNVQQNVYSPSTKERKRLMFQKTLPKHYYPIFMKSLEDDIAGSKELHSTNCDQLTQHTNERALLPLTEEKVTLKRKMSESDENTPHNSSNQAEYSENFMKVVKELCTAPEKEPNINTTAEMKDEPVVLKLPKLQQSSVKEKQDSFTGKNNIQVNEPKGTRNEKGDMASEQQKDHPIPNFSLVQDFDSFLANMLDADNAEINCKNQSNKKFNDSFMANSLASITNLARNEPLTHGYQHNHNEYLHKNVRKDTKYEPVLKLLLKDVSREAAPTSTKIPVNKDYETILHELSSQLQYQPKCQMNCINSGAKNETQLLHSSQKPLRHDSNIMANHNSQHTTSLRNSTQILRGDSSQNDNCDDNYTRSELNYQTSIQKGLTERNIMPEDTNRTSQRNKTCDTWDTTSINIHTEQSPPRQKKSYTQVFEFENLRSTKSCMLPFMDTAVKRAAFHKSTHYANGNNGSSPRSLSQWQKFELPPPHSDESFKLHYHPKLEKNHVTYTSGGHFTQM